MAEGQGYIGRSPGDSSVIIASQTFEPTGIQTNFTFASGYDPGYIDVYLNGARLIYANDYTATDGSTVALVDSASNGDVLECVAYKAFNVATVDSSTGNFTVGQDLTVTGDTTATDINAVGIVTATGGLEVGVAGVGGTIAANGNTTLAGVLTATSFSGSASGLTGIAAKLSDQRPSMKGLTLTDDGTSNPVLDLKSDDDNPWGLIIGNSTYSTNQRGLKILQENGGQVNTRASGQGSYINWNFTQDDGSSSRTLMTLGGSGEVILRHQGNLKLQTTSAGISVTGTVSDSKGDLRKIIHKQESSAYTLVAADDQKLINTNSGVTVPSGVFSASDAVTIVNNSTSTITITQASGVTMYLAGTSTTGNRTLQQKGIATVVCISSNTFIITGGGLY